MTKGPLINCVRGGLGVLQNGTEGASKDLSLQKMGGGQKGFSHTQVEAQQVLRWF